ncbi:V-type ATP synthase subunit H [Deinococcus detaillensis]|uniref:V-type ATP synthase subunit H n=1 Tax=Deinococcus detaillensis TaxID=2592048 RepID=A0A553V6L5_9DEIO|nr:V-type ATPase subunit subunit G family protein [Deinococcus detaillensis]TSA88072.1 V-type ATP synthase subunit H [Deinococcus detaillensis]
MDVSSRVLSELASREQALDAQIEAARQDATREIEAAEAEAARILKEAGEQVKTLTAAREQEMAAEGVRVREEAQAQAKEEVLVAHTRSDAKMGQAVETILRAVLP